MSISKEAIETILDLQRGSKVDPIEMAKHLTLTVFPYDRHKISDNVFNFYNSLNESLTSLGVKIIPYSESLTDLGFKRKAKVILYSIFNSIKNIIGVQNNGPTLSEIKHMRFGKKVKKGISVIALGEHETGNLPMDNTMSFRESSVISILDMPNNINDDTSFHTHFDTAMHLFTHHMTNIAIVVSENNWILYNFNASHPKYRIGDPNFKENLLKGLIPKIAAPIRPPLLTEFKIISDAFDPNDSSHKQYIDDFRESANLLEKTGLYPPGKSLDQMSFRNDFYKWIGRIHLDQRNGMSYGFLARQMNTDLVKLEKVDSKNIEKDYIIENNIPFVYLNLKGNHYKIKIPDVWVITSRSGANKTKLDPNKDIIKMGLVNGELIMKLPKGMKKPDPAYKPSFDTRVILAHAVGNAIIASILEHFDPGNKFSNQLRNNGMAITHWHGYLNPQVIPAGWIVHGWENPHVSCSSPQSAIYALYGKIDGFLSAFESGKLYLGDVHIEPHHGSNMSYWSLKEWGDFLNHRSDVSALGNKYFVN